MRTTEFSSFHADAPFSVKASSILLAAVLFAVVALPILALGASVVA